MMRALVLASGLSLLTAACVSADQWRGYPSTRGAIVSPYGGGNYARFGYDYGYRDGYEKGRGDARNGRSGRYDPTRHGWFKSATRGYENYYGPRQAYQQVYRSGFQAGYDRAFQETFGYRGRPRPVPSGGGGFPWGR